MVAEGKQVSQNLANKRRVFGGMIKEKRWEESYPAPWHCDFEDVLNVEPGKVQLCHALKVSPRGSGAKAPGAANNRHIRFSPGCVAASNKHIK